MTNFICATIMIMNISGKPLNRQDFDTIARAQQVCSESYKDGCLTKFQKREQGVYRAFCGEKEPFNKKMFDIEEKYAIIKEQRGLGLSEEAIKKKLEELKGYRK